MNIRQIYEFFCKPNRFSASYAVVKDFVIFVPTLIIFFATATYGEKAHATVDISPLTHTFSADTKSGVLNLRNRATETKTFELHVYAWTLNEKGEEVRTPSKDIRFSPAVITMMPLSSQVVRFIRAPQIGDETRYRIVLKEITPVSIKGSGIQFNLTLDFAWFFKKATAQPEIVATASGSTISFKNNGNATAQLQNLKIGETIVAPGLVGYVLPGENQVVELPNGTVIPPSVKVGLNLTETTLPVATK